MIPLPASHRRFVLPSPDADLCKAETQRQAKVRPKNVKAQNTPFGIHEISKRVGRDALPRVRLLRSVAVPSHSNLQNPPEHQHAFVHRSRTRRRAKCNRYALEAPHKIAYAKVMRRMLTASLFLLLASIGFALE
jgi:hypothetical protein